MKKLFIFSAMMLTATAALAKDIKTVVLTTNPEMHCENCEKKIKGSLRFEKGIKNIITNLNSKTVTIEYDADKTTVDNIIKGFKKIKYEAKEVKNTPKKGENTPVSNKK
jgi:copper chaperone CopZ